MTESDWLTLLASFIAILVSVVSIRKTNEIADRQFELEKIQAELAAKQLADIKADEKFRSVARLRAEFVGTSANNYLEIRNIGDVEARDVHFSYDAEGELFIGSDIAEKFPLAVLRSMQTVRILALLHDQSPTKCTISLHWKNPDGAEGRDQWIVYTR